MSTGIIKGTMQYVKDTVRGHFNKTDFPTGLLDMAIDQGRREIEEEGNFWWMRGMQSALALNNAQNTYSITGASSHGFNIPDFKDARAAAVKRTGDVEWTIVQIGTTPVQEAYVHFSTTDKGIPEVMYIDNENAVFFPPIFDQTDYELLFFYYQWTANPTGNTGTDALISRFPKALIYASLMWGYEMQLKDQQGAQYWRTLLLGDPPNRRRGELQKIKSVNFLREQQDKLQMTAMQGPFERMRRLRLTQNIWLGAGIGW